MPTKIEKDTLSGRDTTGHEWDGVKELDTPLPRWWLYIFYASIVVAIVYWVLMPAWPGLTGHTRGVLGQSDRVAVVEAVAELKNARAAEGRLLAQASFIDTRVGRPAAGMTPVSLIDHWVSGARRTRPATR